VRSSPLQTAIFAPSIVYDHSDPWVTLLRRFSFLPVMPVSGEGRASFEPIWAADVARCVVNEMGRGGADGGRRARYELAGPEVLSYDEMSDLVSQVSGRPRPLVHLPLWIVRSGLLALRSIFGEAVFATWEEAELMEVPMVSERGTADAELLGVSPRRMSDVLAEG
jgi:NADH dehydrogenase